MKQLTCNTLFSGIGGSDCGLEMAGFAPQLAFEIDPQIAALGQRNTTAHYVVGDICDVNFAQYPVCDVLAASPVCKEFSIAKAGGKESEIDIATARATVRALEAWRPRGFILENVWGYRNSQSFLLICEALQRLGYRFGFWHLCAADFGVAQTRRRLILIATRRAGGHVMPPPPTHSKEVAASLFGGLERWVGWYEAVADLIDDLPETEFAPWQLERLGAMPEFSFLLGDQRGGGFWPVGLRLSDEPAMTIRAQESGGNAPRAFVACGMMNDRGESMTVRGNLEPFFTVNAQTGERQPARAFVVEGSAAGIDNKFNLPTRMGDEPIFTMRAGQNNPRAQIPSGRVVALSPRCLARFQSFPDSYELSGNRKLDTTGIGNAVAPLLMKTVAEHLKNLL